MAINCTLDGERVCFNKCIVNAAVAFDISMVTANSRWLHSLNRLHSIHQCVCASLTMMAVHL
jgi:hypothetical protein